MYGNSNGNNPGGNSPFHNGGANNNPAYPQNYPGGQNSGPMSGHPMAGGGMEFVQWQDPIEGSFTVDVPRGWRVEGGAFRMTPVDVRGELRITSPEGGVHVFSGDRNIPPFVLPTQMFAFTGMGEGSWYSPGYGSQMLIMRYIPGPYFAQDYMNRYFGRQIAGLRVESVKERPDLAGQIQQAAMQYGLQQQVHVGEVVFVGTANGKPMRGYILAATSFTPMPVGMEGGMWHVTTLYGYIAEQGREAEAQAIIVRLMQSTRQNPQWAAQQQGLTAQTSQMVAENGRFMAQAQQRLWQTQQETSDIINRTYEERQRSQDENHRHFGNVIRGETDVRDPNTNEAWRTTAGSRYYWRQTGTDRVVGTDTYQSPGIDWTPVSEF